MDIIGGGKIHVYPPEDEYPHKPGPEWNWQESFVLHFWDAQQGLGGYFRIGHEPNYNGGTLAFWSYIVSPDGVFRRCEDLPLGANDFSKTGLSGGNGALKYEFDGKQIKWTVNEPGVKAELFIEDFHPAVDGNRKEGKLSDFSAQHVEVALGVTGTITTQGNTYKVNAMGIRDHGWGVRQWDTMLSHRWNVGVFDREHSFCAVTMLTRTDVLAKIGWVVRGDKVLYASEVDIAAVIECDGTTNRGGTLRMNLVTGEIFEAKYEHFMPSIVSTIHGLVCVDSFSKVTWGNRVGVGCFETSANIQRGTHIPQIYEKGTFYTNGWFPARA